jgi:hypothetical protein
MKAFFQIVVALVLLAFGTSLLFCTLLGDVLRLHSCDVLLIFVLRSWLDLRAWIGM